MEEIEDDFAQYFCQRFDNTTCLYTGKEYKENDEDISCYSIYNENYMDKTEKAYNIEMQKTGLTFEEKKEESIPYSEPKDQDNNHIFNDNIEHKKQSAKNNKKGLGRKRKNRGLDQSPRYDIFLFGSHDFFPDGKFNQKIIIIFVKNLPL